MKQAFKKCMGIACAAAMALSMGALAACSPSDTEGPDQPGGYGDVAGTYTISYSTSEISGNVRHTGYLSALQCTETNTLVLKEDSTYEYTKYVTSARADAAAAQAYAVQTFAAAKSAPLLTWQSAGDGKCTLVCNADGSYVFEFVSYGMKEEGTWSWSGWTFTLTTPGGTVHTATMDGTTHALNVHYVADSGGGALTHDFTLGSDVWGAAFGGKGDYTPAGGGETDEISVSYYYTGAGQKTTSQGGQTITYDVTDHLFLLSTGDVYMEEATETNASVTLGEWSETDGTVSIALGNETITVSEGSVTIGGLELTLSESIPSDYADADWEQLIEDAQVPAASGPIVIEYVFTGTYTVSGTTVTLNPAETCTWSEDWGSLQNNGFTNVSGGKDDRVYPKGQTGEYYFPLDHFGGEFYFAPVNPSGNTPTNNVAVKVTLDKEAGTFAYSTDSVFDE